MTMRGILPGEEPEVLCVDDQYMNVFCIVAIFQSLGETCIGKLSGAEGIKVVRDRLKLQINGEKGKIRPITIVVLDFQMPEMNGDITWKKMKEVYE